MSEQQPAFAAVDLGASSGRVILGRVQAADPGASRGARVELTEVHRFPNGPVTRAEGPDPADGASLHWEVSRLYRGVLDGLRAATRATGRLDGVGIDTWAVDYGLLDADGALLGQVAHYRDARTHGMPERAFTRLPAADLYRRTGVQVQPFNTAFQLMAEAGGTRLARADRMLLVPDLLAFWLTGRAGAEVTNASTTGLLDVTSRTWAPDVARALGIDPALLPPLHEPGVMVGQVHGQVRADVGHAGELAVVAVGSHDTASAVVAVPAERSDFAYISCGTWSLVGLELTAPVLTEASRAANFTNELGVDGTVRYLRNVMGLWLLQESVRTWAQAGTPVDLPAVLAAAEQVPALSTVVDVDDPVFLPPGDMPARIVAAAERSGQRPPGSPAETVRCILDSLALAYRRAVRQAGELAGRDVGVVHVVGGGSQNVLLCRLTADATGLPVVAGPAEGAALGNVLVQARAAGTLTGGLAELRAVGARGLDLRRYEPGAGPDPVPEHAWSRAEDLLTRR